MFVFLIIPCRSLVVLTVAVASGKVEMLFYRSVKN